MNKDNLLKMANHIETIPQKDFDMGNFRKGGPSNEFQCNTVGCAVGHCTILDIGNVKKNFMDVNGYIEFSYWSKDFTGVYDMEQWQYLFGGGWSITDNTSQGTANRIRYVVKHGFPEDMIGQIIGIKKLSYE